MYIRAFKTARFLKPSCIALPISLARAPASITKEGKCRGWRHWTEKMLKNIPRSGSFGSSGRLGRTLFRKRKPCKHRSLLPGGKSPRYARPWQKSDLQIGCPDAAYTPISNGLHSSKPFKMNPGAGVGRVGAVSKSHIWNHAAHYDAEARRN